MIIDSSSIETKNDQYLLSSKWAVENISLGNAAIDLLKASSLLPLNEQDDITVLRLGIRLINSGGAAGSLSRSGYYEPAAAQVRDIVETGFLLDLFRRDTKQINRWRVCGHEARKRNFSPFELRKALNKLDGAMEDKRNAAYQFFTRHGTHADPETIGLTSPDNNTQIGPFSDNDRVVGLSFEIARYLAAATQYLLAYVISRDTVGHGNAEFETTSEAFLTRLEAFRTRTTDARS